MPRKKKSANVPDEAIVLRELNQSLCDGLQARPFDHLGCHAADKGFQLRAWFPGALSVTCHPWVEDDGSTVSLNPFGNDGLFTASLKEVRFPPYLCRYEVTYPSGTFTRLDPYLLGEIAFSDFPHNAARLYRNLGAHLVEIEYYGRRLQGTRFAVYAPHARSVSVVGDFNQWDGRAHPMGASPEGIWRIFVPEVFAGTGYKFEIHAQSGDLLPHKTDPFGYSIDQFPSLASRIYNHSAYVWGDEDWQGRPETDPLTQPMNIYELHPGSWRHRDGRPLSYGELAAELVPYIEEMGYTHIEFMPLAEHPFTGSWGYQPVGLYASTTRYGQPDELKALIDACHQVGIGVIVDWVPAHFPTDGHGLANFDGTALYEYPDPRKGWHPDWNSLIYDYGREAVCDFLISNALFWLEVFHVDGLRVDAVASMLYLDYSRSDGEWVANAFGGNHNLEAIDFIKRLNETVYLNYPRTLMIAEESTAYPGVSKPTFEGGLGFGFKWNMGWMNDTLRYMQRDHVYRRYHHNELTFGMMYAHTEHFILAISHDEVVHGKRSLVEKMPGDDWQRFANLRVLAGYQMTHPGKKLSFMGGEFGQYREWNYEQPLDWYLLENPLNAGQKLWVRDLNRLYRAEPALYRRDYEPEGFQWLVVDDQANSVLSYLRYGEEKDTPLLVVINLTPVPRSSYALGVPLAGRYKVVLNSDAGFYGGSNFPTASDYTSEAIESHGQPNRLIVDIPPLSAMIFKTVDED